MLAAGELEFATMMGPILGRVVPAAEAMFGHARAEVIGRPVGEVIVPPRHRAAHDAGMRRVTGGGAPRIIAAVAIWLVLMLTALALIHGASKARTDLAEEIDTATGRTG